MSSIDGFELVSRRKAARKKQYIRSAAQQTIKELNDDDVSPEFVLERVERCRKQLEGSTFLTEVSELLAQVHVASPSNTANSADTDPRLTSVAASQPAVGDETLLSQAMEALTTDTHSTVSTVVDGMSGKECLSPCQEIIGTCSVQEVVSYGLGNFTVSPIARYQLAFLNLLCEMLKVPINNCFLYDPHFTDVEKRVLYHLGFQLITVNEEGKRPSTRPTLYYMPHCGKPLYNNLLWANWSPRHLSQTFILGNSFHTMADSVPNHFLQKHFSYIHQILQFTVERSLPNCFEHEDIFNDTSLHMFSVDPRSQPTPTACQLWTDGVVDCEPEYSCFGDDLEIVLARTARSHSKEASSNIT